MIRDNPRKIAERLVESLGRADSVGEAEVAGPGFINFRIRPQGIHSFLEQLADAGARTAMLRDESWSRELGAIQIEFVSANPTGPMNVVSARAAAFGDACVRMLRAVGADVQAEFYVNDAGKPGRDLRRVDPRPPSPGRGSERRVALEDAYRGAYVTELASELERVVAAARRRREGRRRRAARRGGRRSHDHRASRGGGGTAGRVRDTGPRS